MHYTYIYIERLTHHWQKFKSQEDLISDSVSLALSVSRGKQMASKWKERKEKERSSKPNGFSCFIFLMINLVKVKWRLYPAWDAKFQPLPQFFFQKDSTTRKHWWAFSSLQKDYTTAQWAQFYSKFQMLTYVMNHNLIWRKSNGQTDIRLIWKYYIHRLVFFQYSLQ